MNAAEHIDRAEELLERLENFAVSEDGARNVALMASAHAQVARAIQEEGRGVTIQTWQAPLAEEPPQWMVDLGYTRPKPEGYGTTGERP